MLRQGIIAAGLALLAAAAALASVEPAAGGTPAPSSWAFAIGNGHLKGSAGDAAERLGSFDLVVIDGEEATPADLDALRASDATVLAYLSVGTIEKCVSDIGLTAKRLPQPPLRCD
jgi:hypothetical protein